MKVGFEFCQGAAREHLDLVDDSHSPQTARRIVFELFRRSLKDPLLLGTPQKSAWGQSLYDIFLDRFFELLSRPDGPASQNGYERMGRFLEIAGFCRAALNGAFAGRNAERFLRLFFNGGQIRLLADADALFARLVYARMIPKNIGRQIDKKPDRIIVPRPQGRGLLVLPLWKPFDQNDRLDRSLLERFCREEGCDNGYLVYPKQAGFKRFVPLENPQLRMVAAPYSFSFCHHRVREDYL